MKNEIHIKPIFKSIKDIDNFVNMIKSSPIADRPQNDENKKILEEEVKKNK